MVTAGSVFVPLIGLADKVIWYVSVELASNPSGVERNENPRFSAFCMPEFNGLYAQPLPGQASAPYCALSGSKVGLKEAECPLFSSRIERL